MKGKVFPLVILSLLFACSKAQNDRIGNVKIQNIPVDLRTHDLVLDTMWLDAPETSTIGFFETGGDSLYFFDQMTNRIYAYDFEGNLKGQHLGKGDGPREIDRIIDYTFAEGKHIFLSGVGFSFSIYDKYWNRIKVLGVDLNTSHTFEELLDDPKGEYFGIYEFRLPASQTLLEIDDYVYISIDTEHPKFNAFTSEDYWKDARIVAKISLETGKFEEILGRYSDVYLQKQFIPDYNTSYFIHHRDTIYLSFEPDHQIYVCNKDFSPIYSFGNKGLNMKTDYRETDGLGSAFDNNELFLNRVKYGYYTDLSIAPDGNTIFRTYTTGDNNVDEIVDKKLVNKRLQIYKNHALTGDVAIPDRFRIIGYHEDYAFADGIFDGENGKIGIYKFGYTLSESNQAHTHN